MTDWDTRARATRPSTSTVAAAAAKIELNRPEALNAWNKQFGVDLLAAIKRGGRRRRGARRAHHGRRAAASRAAPTSRPASTRRPTGQPDVHTTLDERYHPIMTGDPGDAEAGRRRASTGPRSASAARSRSCSDLIVAAESAYFLLAFVNIGLVPDGGSCLFLPARIGFTRAIEMAMLGERVPAAQALEWGLVNRVVPRRRASRRPSTS